MKQFHILQREIQDAHENSKELEKVLKDLTEEVQEFSRERGRRETTNISDKKTNRV